MTRRRHAGPTAPPPAASLLALLLGALLGTAGCVHRPMPPARQLANEQLVTGGYAAWTPAYVGPQFQGSATYGLGVGDLGVRGGINTGSYLNLALTPRLYLSEFATLALDGDVGIHPLTLPSADTTMGSVSATARLTTTTDATRRVYGGLQGSLTHWFERFDERDRVTENILMGGLVIGGEIPAGDSELQVELTVVPLAHRDPAGTEDASAWQDLGLVGWHRAELPKSSTTTIEQTFMYSQITIGGFNYR